MSGVIRAFPSSPIRRISAALWQVPFVVAGAVLLGFIVVMSPQAAIGLALVPVALLTLYSARMRVLVVVFGGLLLLDSSSGFSYGKVLYLGGLALCLVAAWQSSGQTMQHGVAAKLRRAAGMAWWLMVSIVVLSLPIAILNDHPLTLWLRDVAPYLLLGAAPVLAADASQNTTSRFLTATFVGAGLLVTAAISLQLIGLHGLSASEVQELPLYTGILLPVTLFAYAGARIIHSHNQGGELLVWGAVAGVILTGVLLSGTRSGLLLLTAPVAMLMFGGGLQGLRRAIVLIPVAIALVVVAFAFGASAGIETDAAQERLLTTRSAVRSPQSSGSLQDRFAQSDAAWELFKAAPLTGAGPGGFFEWHSPGGAFRRTFTVDSTVSTLAKFGLIGTVGLLVILGLVAYMVRRAENRAAQAALIGLAAWGCAYAVLSNPLEDKGLALGLVFVLALALRQPASRPATG